MMIKQSIFVGREWSVPLPFEWDDPQTLVLIFSYNPECVSYLCQHFPKSVVIGCSSGGDMFGKHHFEFCTSVSFIKFQKTKLRSSSIGLSYGNSFEVGTQLVKDLMKDAKPTSIMVFTPGLLKINGARFAEGLSSSMKDGVKVFGGVAGDPKIVDTWTIDSHGIHDAKAVGVAFYGDDIICELSTKSGASPLGIERMITKAKGNVVFEVDNKPALEFYHQYLGDDIIDITKTLQFPLAISTRFKIDNGPLRTPQAVSIPEKSVTFTEAIPEGSQVRIMMVSRENIVVGAEKAAAYLKEFSEKNLPLGDRFLFPISCIGRKYILGESIEDEVAAIHEAFAETSMGIHGFYSFGEFASSEAGPSCELHNQTLNLALIFEKKVA